MTASKRAIILPKKLFAGALHSPAVSDNEQFHELQTAQKLVRYSSASEQNAFW